MILINLRPNKIHIFSIIIMITIVITFHTLLIPQIKLRYIALEERSAIANMQVEVSKENELIESEQIDETPQAEKKYIKWVDFKICYAALEKALSIDIKSHETDNPIDWVDILSYLGAKYGGEFSKYKEKDLTDFVKKLNEDATVESLTKDMKYYSYYREAYGAILDEFVGEYSIQIPNEDNPDELIWSKRYGLKVFSPFAKGYGYGDFDDFGSSRSYGYKRKHLGHDMMGSVGTPIVAIESGTVEALGWNQYGGWRIGIRSFDKKRYYYYAHLRKNHPYIKTLKEGDVVKAGDVIGYLGMTGYSTKENVNNITTPHLHYGMQLIFDESQKEGNNEIWIDLYNITKLLQKNKSIVYKDDETKDYFRKYDFTEPMLEDT